MFSFPRIVLILLFLSGFITAFLTAKTFAPDDDLLYLYTAAQSIPAPAEYSREIDKAKEIVSRARGRNDDSVTRFIFRDDYKYNYLFDLTALSIARSFLIDKNSNIAPKAYLEQIRDSIYAAALVSHGLVIFLAMFLVCRTKSPPLFWGYFGALMISMLGFLLEYYQAWPYIPYQLIYSDLSESMQRPLYALFHPGLGFGYFYTNARNTAIILASLVFFLRWDNRITASYFMCFLVVFVHTTSASLILVLLVGLDYVHSPERLKYRATILVVLFMLAVGFIQSYSWYNVGKGFSSFALLPVGIYVLLLAENFIVPLREKYGMYRIDPSEKYLWDVGLICAGFFVIFSMLWVFFYLADNTQEYKYTLTEIPIRLISLLRFPIWMGVGMFLFGKLKDPLKEYSRRTAMVFSLLMICAAGFHVSKLQAAESAGSVTLKLYADSKNNCHKPFSEKVIYYLVSCKIDGVCKGLDAENYVSRCYSEGKNKV